MRCSGPGPTECSRKLDKQGGLPKKVLPFLRVSTRRRESRPISIPNFLVSGVYGCQEWRYLPRSTLAAIPADAAVQFAAACYLTCAPSGSGGWRFSTTHASRPSVDFGVLTNAYTMAPTLPLCEALNESIPSGRFEDTMIALYSRRDTSGNICGLKTLYANSHVLRTVPYLDNRKCPPHFPCGSRDDR